jgi:hypothetical protein
MLVNLRSNVQEMRRVISDGGVDARDLLNG